MDSERRESLRPSSVTCQPRSRYASEVARDKKSVLVNSTYAAMFGRDSGRGFSRRLNESRVVATKAVADGIHADDVLLGQLQQGEQGLRFITHFIRLRDMAHLKANRLPLSGNGISGLEVALVDEFERAVRQHRTVND